MGPDETLCTHCGLPAPASDGEVSFCCHGCRAAYDLLHSCGLERYYELRERLGDGGEVRPVQALPSSEAYAHFDDQGFLADHGQAPGRAELRVSGLHCAACVWVIDRLPHVVDGVHMARVNLATGRLQLEWDPERVALSQIATFLHRLGYPTHAADADAEASIRGIRRGELIRLAVAGAVAGNIMLLSFALYAGASGGMTQADARLFEWASLVLAIPAVTYGAWPFLRGALAGLRVGRLHMDLPISLGIAAGFAASVWAVLTGTGEVYFDSVAALVFLLLVGRWIQQRGQERALSKTTLLHMLLPGTGRRRVDQDWETVPAGRLSPGDELWVRAGEAFPADGRVVDGRTSVDLSSLTGESRPVPAAEGSPVFAGTRNLDADLHVRVEAVGSATRVGSLAEQVDRTRGEQAPVVELADRIAGWFVAAVLTLAVVGGVAWWYVDPSRSFDVVVALLVVSCPCALGLATPAALAIARARAAQRGFLIGSPAVLERLASVRHIVLDKTGTLTRGRMSVVDGPSLDENVLRGVIALESRARHPVADALRAWAGEQGARAGDAMVDGFVERPGLGVEGVVDGRHLRVGSVAWLTPSQAHAERTEAALARGDTPVAIEVDGEVLAIVAVGDALREGAAAAVSRLKTQGYEISLCSGDHRVIVDAVARELGIDRAVGQATPEQKAELVIELGDVAMVGDGINDAPALQAARVGIAVGGGAEAAMHVADVYLGRPGTDALVELMGGARRTMAIVRRNLGFSLAYNLLFASLALAGLISPLLAAILMPLSSLTVLGLSMLGRSFQQPKPAVDPSVVDTQEERPAASSVRAQPAH